MKLLLKKAKSKALEGINNLDFYETIQPEDAEMVAERSGIISCPDINLIYPLIKSKKTLLEVGGGYGRVIDFLNEKKFKGLIEILEPSRNFYKYLTNKYESSYKIHPEKIQNFKTSQKYDVILWMWSQINEFSPKEHLQLLSHIKSLLASEGLLIIDIVDENTTPLFTENKQERYMLLNIGFGKIKLFMIKKDEIINTAKEAGFSDVKVIEYETSKQRKRMLFILSA